MEVVELARKKQQDRNNQGRDHAFTKPHPEFFSTALEHQAPGLLSGTHLERCSGGRAACHTATQPGAMPGLALKTSGTQGRRGFGRCASVGAKRRSNRLDWGRRPAAEARPSDMSVGAWPTRDGMRPSKPGQRATTPCGPAGRGAADRRTTPGTSSPTAPGLRGRARRYRSCARRPGPRAAVRPAHRSRPRSGHRLKVERAEIARRVGQTPRRGRAVPPWRFVPAVL